MADWSVAIQWYYCCVEAIIFEVRVLNPHYLSSTNLQITPRTLPLLKDFQVQFCFFDIQLTMFFTKVLCLQMVLYEYQGIRHEEIEVRLKYRNQMRIWEMYVNGRPTIGPSKRNDQNIDPWGRLLEAELVDGVTIGIPSLYGDGFTKETIRAEYE
ncbi:hypothetical protein Tco_0366946 [Tanacetum coccineum]